MTNRTDDPRPGGLSASWLESELSRQLGPVAAPDALWNRIHEQRRPLRVRPNLWVAWSAAAAALLTLAAGFAWQSHRNPDRSTQLEILAAQELRGLRSGSGQTDIQSADPREIQSWVRAKLDIDIDLPEHSALGSVDVRLLGAHLIESKQISGAVITYRVGNNFAAMLVTGRGARARSTEQHASLPVRSVAGMKLYSWSVGKQDYTIAYGGAEPRRACLLCHAATPALAVFK